MRPAYGCNVRQVSLRTSNWKYNDVRCSGSLDGYLPPVSPESPQMSIALHATQHDDLHIRLKKLEGQNRWMLPYTAKLFLFSVSQGMLLKERPGADFASDAVDKVEYVASPVSIYQS